MKLRIIPLNETCLRVDTELAQYSVFLYPERYTARLVGPGVSEEYELYSFPDDSPGAFAIAAYLVANLEANHYGDSA